MAYYFACLQVIVPISSKVEEIEPKIGVRNMPSPENARHDRDAPRINWTNPDVSTAAFDEPKATAISPRYLRWGGGRDWHLFEKISL